jgi:hypothetical protein
LRKQRKRPTKVAIVAMWFTGGDAPFDDESFEIWTLNHGCDKFRDRRIDKYFDLHRWDVANYMPLFAAARDYEAGYEIITPENYPYQEIIAKYGCFLRNSIPMMLAYAGYLDRKEIYVYGLESLEYTESPEMGFSLYYILGALRAEGRKVWLMNQYTIDTGGIYGMVDLQKTQLGSGFYFKHDLARSYLDDSKGTNKS